MFSELQKIHSDSKANVLLLIVIGMIGIIVLPPLIMWLFPPAKWLFQVISIFIIYSIVRGYLGSGMLTLIVSAILIWLLVFKYTYLFATVFFFQLLIGVQLFSVIIWGIGTSLRQR